MEEKPCLVVHEVDIHIAQIWLPRLRSTCFEKTKLCTDRKDMIRYMETFDSDI